jgi:hypothetical protein
VKTQVITPVGFGVGLVPVLVQKFKKEVLVVPHPFRFPELVVLLIGL